MKCSITQLHGTHWKTTKGDLKGDEWRVKELIHVGGGYPTTDQ